MSTEWRNPYVAGSPIRGQEMFFGRDNVFQWLREHLIGQFQDNAIVLYGERRTGKTSVLYQIPRRLGDASYIPILIDLQQLSLDSIDSFFFQFATKIWGGLRRAQGVSQFPRPQQEDFTSGSVYFIEVFLAQVEEAIKERKLLVMLDEFSRLRTKVESGDLPADIFGHLRSLMADHRLTLVISVGSKLEHMTAEYSVLFNQAIYHRITFLDEADTRTLITQPVKQHYDYREEAIEQIVRATSGHPFYVQHICHAIFARRRPGDRQPVTVQEVEQALPQVVEATAQNLKFIWDDVGAAEKAVLTAAAARLSSGAIVEGPGGTVSQLDIARLLSLHEMCPPSGERVAALHTLRTRDILREDAKDQYSFSIEPLRLWLARERRPDLVRQELSSTGAIARWQRAAASKESRPWWGQPSILPVAAMILLILILLGALLRQTSRLQSLSATATAAAVNAREAAQQASNAAAQAANLASEGTRVANALATQYATATLMATRGGVSAATSTAVFATQQAKEAQATTVAQALEYANLTATVSAQRLIYAEATANAVAIEQSIPTATATHTATPTDTPLPTHTPTATPTATPSSTPSPTLIPTPLPTVAPTKADELYPTVTQFWEADRSTLVFVPAGAFWMGSREGDPAVEAHEKPQHLVTLDSYFIDQYEVTNAQFASFMNAAGDGTQERLWLAIETATVRIHRQNGIWQPDEGYERHPVAEASWYGAEAYCRWAGKRLPTEAEWEKAARGPDRRIYPWGNEFDGTRLNFCDVNCERTEWRNANWSDGYAQTAPVDSYPDGQSPYGAFNMAGNVWEWVADRYAPDYYARSPQIAPQGPSTGDLRIHRGGSWDSTEWFVRTAYRYPALPAHHAPTVGFRCALSGPEP